MREEEALRRMGKRAREGGRVKTDTTPKDVADRYLNDRV